MNCIHKILQAPYTYSSNNQIKNYIKPQAADPKIGIIKPTALRALGSPCKEFITLYSDMDPQAPQNSLSNLC